MKLLQAVLSLLILSLIIPQSEQVGVNSGPYDVDVHQIYPCSDQGTNTTNVKISLYLGKEPGPKYKKHLHRGSFTFPFSDEEIARIEIRGLFYQRKTNDFLLMYKYEGNYCQTMDTIAPVSYKAARKAIGADPEGGCHLPPGNYSFNDHEVEFSLPTPMLEYGYYKATLKFVLDNEVFACIEGVGVVKRKY